MDVCKGCLADMNTEIECIAKTLIKQAQKMSLYKEVIKLCPCINCIIKVMCTDACPPFLTFLNKYK